MLAISLVGLFWELKARALPYLLMPVALAGLILDEAAIGVINNKTTAVRVLPVPGKQAGDLVALGGLLGSAPVMRVNPHSPRDFMRRGGRLPSPVTSLRN